MQATGQVAQGLALLVAGIGDVAVAQVDHVLWPEHHVDRAGDGVRLLQVPCEDLVGVGEHRLRALLATTLHDGEPDRRADVVPAWGDRGETQQDDQDRQSGPCTKERAAVATGGDRRDDHPEGDGHPGEQRRPTEAGDLRERPTHLTDRQVGDRNSAKGPVPLPHLGQHPHARQGEVAAPAGRHQHPEHGEHRGEHDRGDHVAGRGQVLDPEERDREQHQRDEPHAAGARRSRPVGEEHVEQGDAQHGASGQNPHGGSERGQQHPGQHARSGDAGGRARADESPESAQDAAGRAAHRSGRRPSALIGVRPMSPSALRTPSAARDPLWIDAGMPTPRERVSGDRQGRGVFGDVGLERRDPIQVTRRVLGERRRPTSHAVRGRRGGEPHRGVEVVDEPLHQGGVVELGDPPVVHAPRGDAQQLRPVATFGGECRPLGRRPRTGRQQQPCLSGNEEPRTGRGVGRRDPRGSPRSRARPRRGGSPERCAAAAGAWSWMIDDVTGAGVANTTASTSWVTSEVTPRPRLWSAITRQPDGSRSRLRTATCSCSDGAAVAQVVDEGGDERGHAADGCEEDRRLRWLVAGGHHPGPGLPGGRDEARGARAGDRVDLRGHRRQAERVDVAGVDAPDQRAHQALQHLVTEAPADEATDGLVVRRRW